MKKIIFIILLLIPFVGEAKSWNEISIEYLPEVDCVGAPKADDAIYTGCYNTVTKHIMVRQDSRPEVLVHEIGHFVLQESSVIKMRRLFDISIEISDYKVAEIMADKFVGFVWKEKLTDRQNEFFIKELKKIK